MDSIEELKKEIKNQLDAKTAGLVTPEKAAEIAAEKAASIIEVKAKALSEELSAMKETAKAQADKIDSMKSQQAFRPVPFRDLIAEAVKENLSKLKLKDKDVEWDTKAICCSSVTATSGTVMYGAEVEAGVTAPTYPTTQSILDVADVRPTNSARIVYMERVPDKDNKCKVDLIVACGDVKPVRDLEWVESTSEAYKHAEGVEVCEEMLDDYDFIADEIDVVLINDIRQSVANQARNYLLNNAPAYSLTGITTTNGNIYDAIVAACTQISQLGFKATVVILNPIDVANMKLLKDANGAYLFQFDCENNTVCCLKVIEDDCITIGSFIAGDFSKLHIRAYKGLTMRSGWNGNNFIQNKKTIIGEERVHVYIKSNNLGAFISDTFNNIINSF